MGSLKQPLQSFDAAKFALCEEALTSALTVLQAYNWKTALARNIAALAAAGETDRNQLRKRALENLFAGQ